MKEWFICSGILAIWIIAYSIQNIYDKKVEIEAIKAGLIQCSSHHNGVLWKKVCD